MQRNDHRQVELHLAAVVGGEVATRPVDLSCVELGHQIDALLRQHSRKLRRGHRLGEGAVERGDVRQLHLVTDAALVEVPVGQEAELERGDRALDGHVHDVDDQPAAVEGGQRRCQCCGSLE